MMQKIKSLIAFFERHSNVVLRLGMAIVILWFGIQQVLYVGLWTAYIPDSVVTMTHLSAVTLVYLNALFELLFGTLMLFGWQTRLSALLLSLHLFDIMWVVGYGEIGVRDFGLAVAILVVSLNGPDLLCVQNKEESHTSNRGLWVGGVTLLIIILITLFSGKKVPEVSAESQTTSGLPDTTNTQVSQVPVDTKKQPSSVYKDGTYSATGSYMSPGGGDTVSVTVTLAKDIVVDSEVVSGANDRTSERYQNRFISGYKQYVIGKKLADLHLTKVSGASLTPIGFNDALAQIKARAQM
ncbi:MAG: hypothetical protein RLZZ347_669 [Candidatus Parcubacteria bacterium]|jgi:uncharacterized membrane protein YphA (DoxX/SURF4 family)/uncharacterized protein with FMN-binding domain